MITLGDRTTDRPHARLQRESESNGSRILTHRQRQFEVAILVGGRNQDQEEVAEVQHIHMDDAVRAGESNRSRAAHAHEHIERAERNLVARHPEDRRRPEGKRSAGENRGGRSAAAAAEIYDGGNWPDAATTVVRGGTRRGFRAAARTGATGGATTAVSRTAGAPGATGGARTSRAAGTPAGVVVAARCAALATTGPAAGPRGTRGSAACSVPGAPRRAGAAGRTAASRVTGAAAARRTGSE